MEAVCIHALVRTPPTSVRQFKSAVRRAELALTLTPDRDGVGWDSQDGGEGNDGSEALHF